MDLYDMFTVAARQLGSDINRKHRPDAIADQDYVFEALVRIHARACLIASEIRALMVSGHASGALARWRSLHELAVIAYFIREHGNDVAERYMLHEVVQTAKQAEKYERHHETLKNEPLDPRELKRIRENRDELIGRFGPGYARDYGWAAGVMPGNPTFERIEEVVGLAHWRPYVALASHSVHANFKGMAFDLGVSGSDGYATVALAGPSNAGLADPGQSAVMALMNCTVALINHKPTPENVVGMKVLQRLLDEVVEAFIQAHIKLEQDEARYGS